MQGSVGREIAKRQRDESRLCFSIEPYTENKAMGTL